MKRRCKNSKRDETKRRKRTQEVLSKSGKNTSIMAKELNLGIFELAALLDETFTVKTETDKEKLKKIDQYLYEEEIINGLKGDN